MGRPSVSLLCVLCLCLSPGAAWASDAESAVYAGARSHIQLQTPRNAAAEACDADAGGPCPQTAVGRTNVVTGPLPQDGLVLRCWDGSFHEDADISRQDDGDEGIPGEATSQAGVVCDSRGYGKRITRSASRSSSHSAGLVLQHSVIVSTRGFARHRIPPPALPTSLYALHATYLI